MKFLVLLVLAVPALAGVPAGGAFATLTFTPESGAQWVDSGIVRRFHSEPSPVPGYSIEVFEFPDHTDVFHLDAGTLDVAWR